MGGSYSRSARDNSHPTDISNYVGYWHRLEPDRVQRLWEHIHGEQHNYLSVNAKCMKIERFLLFEWQTCLSVVSRCRCR